MTKPVRLQLSRRKGYTLQSATIEANGLPAVNVSRPSIWGNPYRVGGMLTQLECVEAFHDMWTDMLKGRPDHARRQLATLRGKNLACWCKIGNPCHADVLIELANRDEIEAR